MMKSVSIFSWFPEMHVLIWKNGNTILPIATVPRGLLHNTHSESENGPLLVFSDGWGAGRVLWQVQDNVYLGFKVLLTFGPLKQLYVYVFNLYYIPTGNSEPSLMLDIQNTKMNEESILALENAWFNGETGIKKVPRQSRLTW